MGEAELTAIDDGRDGSLVSSAAKGTCGLLDKLLPPMSLLAMSKASSSSHSIETIDLLRSTATTEQAHPAVLRSAGHWCENFESQSGWERQAPRSVLTSANRSGNPGLTSSAQSHGADLLQHVCVMPTHRAAACCAGCNASHSPIAHAPVRPNARPALSIRCLHQASQASDAPGSRCLPPSPATLSTSAAAASCSSVPNSSQLCAAQQRRKC